MAKRKRGSTWNYRIVAEKKSYEGKEGETSEFLCFSIVEVYYKDGKPVGYGDYMILNQFEDPRELKGAYKRIKKAFSNPILDANRNLKKWKRDYKWKK